MPWLNTDHAQLAEWITNHQYIIDKLFQAAEFEKCRFPIVIDIDQTASFIERIKSMRQWTFLLSFAGNNDLGEGKIDAAIAKWRCIIQMANHLRQQSASTEYIVGIRVEAIAVKQASAYIVQGDPEEYQLHKIASLPIDTKNELNAVMERIHPVDELILLKFKRGLGVIDRLKYELGIGLIASMKNSGNKVIHGEYEKALAYKRGLHILVAMKRYQKQHHSWPKSLDAIRQGLSDEILLDPLNEGEFVYRLTGDGFEFYSKGKNSIDERGQYKGSPETRPDDWPIWPPEGQ